jgi:hypothetical protein
MISFPSGSFRRTDISIISWILVVAIRSPQTTIFMAPNKSFRDYKAEGDAWITLATGEYYPDVLPDACRLYEPVLVQFGLLLKASAYASRGAIANGVMGVVVLTTGQTCGNYLAGLSFSNHGGLDATLTSDRTTSHPRRRVGLP